ncbi:MAG: DUF892 family protein [Gemmatimonadota bacterium]
MVSCSSGRKRSSRKLEKQLVKALPQMAKGVNSDELRAALEEHREVTKERVSCVANGGSDRRGQGNHG